MNLNRILSALIMLVYLVLAVKKIVTLGFVVMGFLGCIFIWFPELMKVMDILNPGGGRVAPLDPDSPPCLYVALGWSVLLWPMMFIIILKIAE